MTRRFQNGHLRCAPRKNGPAVWELLWRDQDDNGLTKRHTACIGSVQQYPTREMAEAAASGLRLNINKDMHRTGIKPILLGDLIDHYVHTRLLGAEISYSEATKIVYRQFLEVWIRPTWGATNIRAIRTVEVEVWLSQLRLKDGEAMAESTKAKIRNLLSLLFNHAIRQEWLEQGKNPITFVRQPATRKKIPAVLEPAEIQLLLSELEPPFSLLVLLDLTTGLRRSELFALKWGDIDIPTLTINVTRSIFEGVVGKCKTRASQAPIPLAPYVATQLSAWREKTNYKNSNDWVFTNPSYGLHPFWPNRVLTREIQPAAARAGITKRIGWHTFRRTYATLLVANGENVKVVQELMRHASSRSTLEIYTQANGEDKREAQQRLLQMIAPQEHNDHIMVASEELPDSLPELAGNLSASRLLSKWEDLEQEERLM